MAGPDPELASGPAQPVRVAALYQFTRFPNVESLKGPLLALCEEQGIRGTLLLAPEGVNGTIAGSDAGIDAVLAHLRALPGCAGLDVKESRAAALPFDRMKVRLKREIVTMGEPDIDPLATGHYVAPEEWNALIDAPDTIVIDTRNAYEVALGTFKGAIDPETRSFREFPEWFRQFRKDREAANGPMPRVAMFCTGGIRCEKSTAFLKAEGIDEVYHLKGGILAYLEQVPQEQSRWEGECFVFDQRVTVDHALQPGNRALCKRCQGLIASEDGPCPACDHLAFREQG